jgi:hypothetical protein
MNTQTRNNNNKKTKMPPAKGEESFLPKAKDQPMAEATSERHGHPKDNKRRRGYRKNRYKLNQPLNMIYPHYLCVCSYVMIPWIIAPVNKRITTHLIITKN